MSSYGNSKLQTKNFASAPQFFSWWKWTWRQRCVLELMKRHISILGEEIRLYFPDLEDFQKYCRFVNNPFETSVGDLLSRDSLLQKEFIVTMDDENAWSLHSEKPCSDFWIEMAQTYPDISKMALKVLIPFPTTYEWESAVSPQLVNKPKAQNWLDAIHDMRVPLFKAEPTELNW